MSRLTALLSFLVFGLVITSVAFGNPITIIGVSAPTVGDGVGIAKDEFLQVSWPQTGSYSGVNISALLFGGIVNGSYLPTTGEAFLTSSLLGAPLKQIFAFPDPFIGPSNGWDCAARTSYPDALSSLHCLRRLWEFSAGCWFLQGN